MKIPFNKPFLSGNEQTYLTETILNTGKFSGDGPFTKKVSSLLEQKITAKKALLTTSCTHALEMAAILCDFGPGDEVIMPSYTFVSTANAFVLRGATIVWADVDPAHMNLDINSVKKAITSKTKAIVPVHYAGQSCDMDSLMAIAKEHNLFVIEDAAQSLGSTYHGKHLGTFGDLAALSFHETKNIHCGEGGALIINNATMLERAEIIREKGTNRSKFFRGEVDKYTWVDLGSSYLPSELNAAFLLAQLESEEQITQKRKSLWDRYQKNLSNCSQIQLMEKMSWNNANGHIFYIFVPGNEKLEGLIQYLKESQIYSTFHYIPLHSSPFGKGVGRAADSLKNTQDFGSRLLRLPMYYDLSLEQVDFVCAAVQRYFS